MSKVEELRRLAEKVLVEKAHPPTENECTEISVLLHELSVHQIELETQNEELRAAQQTGEEMQRHLSQLYHQAPVGYISLDQQGRILEANDTFSRLLNIPLNQLKGKFISEFMPEPDKRVFIIRYNGFYQQPDHKTLETSLLAAQNNVIPVLLDARHYRQTFTKQISAQDVLLVTVTNMTEIKKSQLLLIKAKEEAELANLAKSQFLSQMSHNLRTPLNAILGFGQLLQIYQPVRLTAQQNEYIEHILAGGRYLLNLINDVLSFAKIEAGKLNFSDDKVNVDALLKELFDIMTPEAEQRDISLTYQPTDSGVDVHVAADITRTKEILLNLLSNALKYNRKNGSITLSYQVKNNACRIFVKDTGIGLTRQQQQKLFSPFERLGAETSGIEGTGIGLVICKRLVEAMNGTIGLDSFQGEGSTFWIELPLANEAGGEMVADTSIVSQEENHSCVILYIEDNPINMDLMVAYFSPHKHVKLLQASTPAQGLELAKTKQPQVILLDIQLPEMDGFDVFQHLKRDKETQHIPVIAVSAFAMSKDITKAMQLGFYDYVTKPFNFKNLLTIINGAINL